MRNERIEDIKKRFTNEWVLIAVTESNRKTSASIRGRLLAHSPKREDIYKKLLQVKSKLPTLVDYSSNDLPKGMVAAF